MVKALDEPSNQEEVSLAAQELRYKFAQLHIDGHPHNRVLKDMPVGPRVNKDTVDLMIKGFQELVKGFDDAADKWGARQDAYRHRRRARQASGALYMERDLSKCQQVTDYVNDAVDAGIITRQQAPKARTKIAHQLTGCVISYAIENANQIGLTQASVDRFIFPGHGLKL